MDNKEHRSLAAQSRQPHGAAAVTTGRKMNIANLHINQTVIDALRPVPGDRKLEIGMGNGYFVKDIFHLNDTIHYTGCDFSEAIVPASKKNAICN